MSDTTEATLAEICIVALAEAFRGDGEVLCNPMGPVPVIAGRPHFSRLISIRRIPGNRFSTTG